MNKILNDLLPAIVFFTIYKAYDIFYATAALIIITIAQVIWEYMTRRRIAKIQILITVLVVIFGGATLYFHNEEFIKWKVSIVNWLIGIGLIITTYIMKVTPMERLLKEIVNLSPHKWKVINNMWGAYFVILGTINLFVAYFFSTNIWMNFKLFGLLGITFAFMTVQSLYLSKNMKK
ncbi:septation protein IspZ [Allofrancisella guangzhouensis]|uniref:Inner membrane-spanning protein YciB n=1 Tax=Allofrancisella guangzhouensis TaxID=594679 RepID=A0A0A8E677_9GAMM|nr:inner membrane-spanning protein YciB [Allofrancisella guangzhouensis]AJC49474.1 septation protein A [Allofrancisella guangzhouensis]MBK2027989.1 septation protein IspZ [Allofrancisella guangzhouensis]MBK2044931.1 septation protein IspZ [Allofrancisella guangzhouensis]MBK2045881.1 septation protein IspZ [Allofrancisella guangzhouensis]